MTYLYFLVRAAAWFCFKNLGRLDIVGRENVPPYGPLIVVSNHLSFTDPAVLAVSVPRSLYFIGKKELFSNPVTSYIMRQVHTSPFDRSGLGADTVRTMLRQLAQDKAVVLFPEGHRSPDHTMKEGMLGVAYLALKSQAPILPVGITGTEKVSALRMPIPLCRFRANIGQPFTLPVIEGRPSRDVLRSLLDMIMDRIAYLLPKEYRGNYAGGVSIDPAAPDSVAPVATGPSL